MVSFGWAQNGQKTMNAQNGNIPMPCIGINMALSLFHIITNRAKKIIQSNIFESWSNIPNKNADMRELD